MDYLNNWGINSIPHIDDRDNPFRAAPISDRPVILRTNGYGLIACVPREDMLTLRRFARNAFGHVYPVCRRDYGDSLLVAYQVSCWDDENKDIKRLMEFLRLIAASSQPVAFVRWGTGFEVYANPTGCYILDEKVRLQQGSHMIELAPDDDPYSDIE